MRVLKNTLISLAGSIIPMVVMLVTMPLYLMGRKVVMDWYVQHLAKSVIQLIEGVLIHEFDKKKFGFEEVIAWCFTELKVHAHGLHHDNY